MVIRAAVTPRLLVWARRRRGMKRSDVAKKMHVSPDTVAAWERGAKKPTFAQARKFAGRLYVPFGYLYLREPPIRKMPLADFRTSKGGRPEPSPDLLDVLTDVMGKQDWLKEYRMSEEAEELPFVGRFDTTDSEVAVADDVRNTLGVDDARRRSGNGDEFLRELIRNAEASEIALMRSGVIRGNNRRPLDRDEFRGFSISDKIAPLVFINKRDFKGAQIFTLAHEMAHIWTGKGGVSNPDYGFQRGLQEMPVEQFCNRVAAETLVPSDDFLPRWRSGGTSLKEKLDCLRRYYKVSAVVVLRRAFDNDLIKLPEYQKRYAELVGQAAAAEVNDNSNAGGSFYRTLIARNGKMFTEALMASVAQGATLSKEAAYMLGVSVKTLSGISEHLDRSRTDRG